MKLNNKKSNNKKSNNKYFDDQVNKFFYLLYAFFSISTDIEQLRQSSVMQLY